jgi:ABC-type protease/lipase transport system fused ATPase/permease subunit
MGKVEPEAIIEAAKKVGAHEMILSLSKGYETAVGNGNSLSAGQRQLVGLARAIFGNPVLLLLDEPTANLDSQAAKLTIETLQRLQKNGAIIMAASHDHNLISSSSHILAIRNGAASIANTKQYMQSLQKPAAKVKAKTQTAGAAT